MYSARAFSLLVLACTGCAHQVFAATFAESGGLTSVQYANTSGTAAALKVIDTALTTAQGQAAKKAQALNERVELIRAQQRYVQCQADPKNCQ